MDRPLAVAIVGYGLAGRVFHAPLVAATAGMAVAAIVTGDPGRRAQAAREHPEARLVAAAEELWADPGALDLVVVAAAAVIGGTSLFGGRGTAWSALLGAW